MFDVCRDGGTKQKESPQWPACHLSQDSALLSQLATDGRGPQLWPLLVPKHVSSTGNAEVLEPMHSFLTLVLWAPSSSTPCPTCPVHSPWSLSFSWLLHVPGCTSTRLVTMARDVVVTLKPVGGEAFFLGGRDFRCSHPEQPARSDVCRDKKPLGQPCLRAEGGPDRTESDIIQAYLFACKSMNLPRSPNATTSIKGLMVSVAWYSRYLKG